MKYVALLRGVNVGGNGKVSMAHLKAYFESLGFSDVKTYINSGNVIFSTTNSSSLVAKIENGLKKRFKMDLRIVVRDKKNIDKLVKAIPAKWTNDKEMRTDVLFLWDAYDKKSTLKEIAVNPDVDTLKYISGAIVWHFDRKNYTKSRMHKFIGTAVYRHMTARNVNTVRKLAALMK